MSADTLASPGMRMAEIYDSIFNPAVAAQPSRQASLLNAASGGSFPKNASAMGFTTLVAHIADGSGTIPPPLQSESLGLRRDASQNLPPYSWTLPTATSDALMRALTEQVRSQGDGPPRNLEPAPQPPAPPAEPRVRQSTAEVEAEEDEDPSSQAARPRRPSRVRVQPKSDSDYEVEPEEDEYEPEAHQRSGRTSGAASKEPKVNVRPNVHRSFHAFVNGKLQELAPVQGATARKKKSDARVIAAICHHMVAQVDAHPELGPQAAEEFATYQVEHKACSADRRKGIRVTVDTMPALEALLLPKSKRLNGIMLEYLLLAAIGQMKTFTVLATDDVLRRAMQSPAMASPRATPMHGAARRSDAAARRVSSPGASPHPRQPAAPTPGDSSAALAPVAVLDLPSPSRGHLQPLFEPPRSKEMSIEELEARIVLSADAKSFPGGVGGSGSGLLRDPPPLDRLYAHQPPPRRPSTDLHSTGGPAWSQGGSELRTGHAVLSASRDVFLDGGKRAAVGAPAELPDAKRRDLESPREDAEWLVAYDQLLQFIDAAGVVPTSGPLGDWAHKQLAEARRFGVSLASKLTPFQYMKLSSVPAFMADLTGPPRRSSGDVSR